MYHNLENFIVMYPFPFIRLLDFWLLMKSKGIDFGGGRL
jgi:hypothetical protein